jgi:hypothetical protein
MSRGVVVPNRYVSPMTYTLPDGTVIEVTGSDGYSGPNVVYGQRVGSALWWRRPGELWVRSKWRTMHKLVEWISLCENMADFLEGEDEAL